MKNVYTYVVLVFVLFSCSQSKKEDSYITIKGITQGTYYSITYKSISTHNIQKSIDSLLHEFDLQFSNYISNSVISRINSNDSTVIINENFEYFWNKSIDIHNKTYGYFDISISDIINAWNFGYTKQTKIPTQQIVDSLMQYKGMQKMHILNHRFVKQNSNFKIVSNAIAQGYAVDLVCEFLEKQNITDFLVDIGGEMKALGVNSKGKTWNIGITKPIDNVDSLPIEQSYYVTVSLKNQALATSGNYRKFYIIDGKKYSHIINPNTGYPAQSNILSASVFAKECIEADAVATACMVMSLDSIKAFFNTNKEYNAVILYNINDSIHVFKTKEVIINY